MTPKPNYLHLAADDTPDPVVTRGDIAMAAIIQSHREWSGPNGKGWHPFSEAQANPTLDPDEVLRRQYRVVAGRPLPAARRLLRWLRRVG